jgi:hypothetical protein
MESKSEQAKMNAIARSSELVGSLMKCPKCSRTVLLKPGGADSVFFQRED